MLTEAIKYDASVSVSKVRLSVDKVILLATGVVNAILPGAENSGSFALTR